MGEPFDTEEGDLLDNLVPNPKGFKSQSQHIKLFLEMNK